VEYEREWSMRGSEVLEEVEYEGVVEYERDWSMRGTGV